MLYICYSIPEKSKTEYELLEEQCHSKFDRRCIDGRIRGCGKCVGYCKNVDHPGFLTRDQRKEHDCIGKGCHYYVSKK